MQCSYFGRRVRQVAVVMQCSYFVRRVRQAAVACSVHTLVVM